MEAFELILLLLAAVLLSAVIDQVVPKVSSPLIQIGLGLLIAFFSVSPIEIHLDPELFIVLLIAPLLFWEAKKVNKAALWTNKVPVLSLAIGLVFASALIIGFYVNWFIPSIPLAAAFALGAGLGPTDAVAVASLSKEVNLNERQKALLEGESLINDASGIVSFQFAIAAVITGSFVLVDASVSFLLSFFGGILIGIVLGFAVNFVSNRARSLGLDNTTFHVLLEVFMPFIIYLAAHTVGASGILAVVAAGLVIAISPKEVRPAVSRANIVSNSLWQVLCFALNGVVFVLLGLQLPTAMQNTWDHSLIGHNWLIIDIVVITAMMLLARYLWIIATEAVGMRRREGRRFAVSDLKAALVTTLAGPKGAFTLALLMTIPLTVTTAEGMIPFPQRSLLLFLASGVIILTLLLATFVVPVLAPKRQPEGDELKDESTATIEVLRKVIEVLTEQQTPETHVATQSVVRSYNARIARHKSNVDPEEATSKKELRVKALGWEEEFIQDLIEKEEVDSVVGYSLINRLTQAQNLIINHSGNLRIARSFIQHPVLVARSLVHLMSHMVTRTDSHHREEARDLQRRAGEYAIGKLHDEMGNPQTLSEDVSKLLLEYQRSQRRLRSERPEVSVTTITKAAADANDIGRIGLNLELDLIQAMYESERITHATAKRMRENVNLMQLDLDKSI
ncbi:MAG: sodium:proton antiporter [Eggerthellaceae bacterium]|nr:sodium:proton antiporter [Eggerthellaceae bacterium]